MNEVEVAVVGLGPVGSTLSALLGRAGIRVLAVDRDPEVFALPRAAHIDHMGLRTLQAIGVLNDLMPDMIPNPGLDFVTSDRDVLMRIPGDQGSVSGLPASMYFHQPGVDRALRTAAASVADVRLGTEMVSYRADDDGVTLSVKGPDGQPDMVRASWLVGCDGAWSRVREASGMVLEDLSFDEPWLVVDLQLNRPVATLPRHAVHVCDPERPHTAIPMPGRRYRFELQLRDGERPETVQRPEVVARMLRRWLPADAAKLERAAVYTFHGLVARTWRAGRVFIAGDAAHQMPPFLGQGMCSGLRDAVNLAWKLTHVLRHGAPIRLLDTYEQERRPHVRAITEAVIEFGAVICARDADYARERDQQLLADRRPPEARLPFRLPHLTSGPLVLDGGGRLLRQPEALVDGSRLDDAIGPRFFVLATQRTALGSTATWWEVRVGAFVVALDELPAWRDDLGRWMNRLGADVVVARPDRYLLAAARRLDDVTPRVLDLLGPA